MRDLGQWRFDDTPLSFKVTGTLKSDCRRSPTRNGTHCTGRLGGLKVLIFKSRDVADDGSAIWELKLAQAVPYEKRERVDHQGPRQARSNRLTTA
jgi:hypothetical protein